MNEDDNMNVNDLTFARGRSNRGSEEAVRGIKRFQNDELYTIQSCSLLESMADDP